MPDPTHSTEAPSPDGPAINTPTIPPVVIECQRLQDQVELMTGLFTRAEQQVTQMRQELRRIEAALDDPRCNLTHTAAECIRDLRSKLAKYESQKVTL